MNARIGGTNGHCDRSTHLHAGVESVERSQPTEGIATDVAEHACTLDGFDDFVQSGVEIAVAAALAQCRRTRNSHLRSLATRHCRQTDSQTHTVGRELTRARQRAVEASLDGDGRVEHTLDAQLHQRLAFLNHQNAFALGGHAANQRLGQRILRNLKHGERTSVRIVLHQVVVGDSTGNDSHAVVVAVDVLVVAHHLGLMLKLGIILDELFVAHFCVAGQKHPLTRILGEVQLILVAYLTGFDHCARVSHARGHAHEYRDAEFLGEVVGLSNHAIGLLL